MNLPPAVRVAGFIYEGDSTGQHRNCLRGNNFHPRKGSDPADLTPCRLLRSSLGRAAAAALGRAQGTALARSLQRPLGVEFRPLLGDQLVAPAGLLAQPA